MKTSCNLVALAFIGLFLPALVSAQSAKDFYNNGIAKAKDSDYVAAIQEYNKAIQLDSNNAIIYFNRAISKVNLKDYEGAIVDYTKSSQLQPSAETYFNRGFARYKAANLIGAMEDFDQAIAMNPTPAAEIYFYRGNIRFMNDDFATAITEFSKAIEIKSDYAKAYFNKGLSEHHLKQSEQSCKDFMKAKELGYPDSQAAITKYCNQ